MLFRLNMLSALLLAVFSWVPPVLGQELDCPQAYRYTFSWSQSQDCEFTPRGGTSTGIPVTLDPVAHPGWLSLQQPGLTKKEKDRRAILAMAGPYRASFEFLEVVAYTPEFERGRPYQSWGTENIYVLEDNEDFISLQHIIVMFVKGEDDEILGPFVQKHWRQDWAFEKTQVLGFTGQNTWTHQNIPSDEISGSWSQSVFQVDDSPRYESWGRWQHRNNVSTWESEETWRPLPRRESSVRDDYQVLIGSNRHSIVPDGWVHEEENYKVALNAKGEISGESPYLAKELGVNRYQRIVNFDFSAGDEYWLLTADFWQGTREVWAEMIASDEQHTILSEVNDMPLFAVLFSQADEFAEDVKDGGSQPEKVKAQIRASLQPYFP